MRTWHSVWAALGLGIVLALTTAAFGQQVTVATPNHTLGDSFFERTGVNWGVSGPGWNFSFGGSNLATPQFGGYDPSAGANFGFGFGGRGFGGTFNGSFAQGYRQNFVSQTPMVTLQNGVPGYVSDTSQSPFVVGFVPVVGGQAPIGAWSPGPLPAEFSPSANSGSSPVRQALQRARANQANADDQRRANVGQLEMVGMPQVAVPPVVAPKAKSRAPADDQLLADRPAPTQDAATSKLSRAGGSTAGQAAPSVAEAKRLHALEAAGQNSEVDGYLERARNAEAQGKPNVARQYYHMALRRAAGETKEEIQKKLEAISASR